MVHVFWTRSRTHLCLKKGEPPSKPKYVFKTNSEQVPWGKGEKNPKKGSEKDPETRNFQSVGALSQKSRRTFCIMGQRVNEESKLKRRRGGEAKASMNGTYEFFSFDPKLSDLALTRLKKA